MGPDKDPDRTSMGLDMRLDRSRWASIGASISFDRGLDRTSMGLDGLRQGLRWASIRSSIGPRSGDGLRQGLDSHRYAH